MKKLLTVISVVCLGIFGLSSSALAGGPDFECGEYDEEYCAGGVTWEVELNCWDTSLANDAYQGGLDVATDDGDWELDVKYDDDTTGGDGFMDFCKADGEVNTPKTEMKCTLAPNGSNKPNKNKTDGFAQVDFEIKYVGDTCP
jgi:hypothetical protein